jgi:hypothetical protein
MHIMCSITYTTDLQCCKLLSYLQSSRTHTFLIVLGEAAKHETKIETQFDQCSVNLLNGKVIRYICIPISFNGNFHFYKRNSKQINAVRFQPSCSKELHWSGQNLKIYLCTNHTLVIISLSTSLAVCVCTR